MLALFLPLTDCKIKWLILFLFQPCVIRIEDVFETPEVLYIILELYHSMKHSTSNISFISFFVVSCIDGEYNKS